MKKIYLILILAMITTVAFGQKNVWIYKVVASDIAGTEILSGKTVKLAITDQRIIDGKTKVKFTSEEIKNTIVKTLEKACPKANFSNGSVALEIDIDRFDTRFTGGVWTGIVRYKVTVNGGEETVIEGTNTRFNFGGNGTAKKMAQGAFDDANKKLLNHLQSLNL